MAPSPSSTESRKILPAMQPAKTRLLPNAPPQHQPMEMPAMGLGTWQADKNLTKEAVIVAIRDAGYRLIDTANDYGNENEVGEGLEFCLKNGIVKRNELFVQCKLWNSNMRPANVRDDLVATLNDLKLDYVDNFVVHWPMCCPAVEGGEGGPRLAWNTKATWKEGGTDHLTPGPHDNNTHEHIDKGTMFPIQSDRYYASDNSCHYTETWQAMEALVDEGLCRGIGISNFNTAQIIDLLANGCKKYRPTVLQCECHLYLQEKDMSDFCRHHGIVYQCYSPLGSGADNPAMIPLVKPKFRIIENPVVVAIAEKHGKSPAQIALRYLLELGKTLVTKSVTPSRICENYAIWNFCLSDEDFFELSALSCGNRNLLWTKTAVHPDYPFKDWIVGELKAAKNE